MPSDILTCLAPDLSPPSPHFYNLGTVGERCLSLALFHRAGEVGIRSLLSLTPCGGGGPWPPLFSHYTAKVVVGGNTCKVTLTYLSAFKFSWFLPPWSIGISLETWNSTKSRSSMDICPIQCFTGDAAESVD